MKRVLALLLCLVMVFSVTACGKKDKKEETKSTTATTSAPVTTTTTEPVPVSYAHNEIINRFFLNYMAVHKGLKMDTDTIRRHPNKPDNTAYLVQINECEVTVTDVSKKKYPSGVGYALQVDIVSGVTAASVDKLMTAFIFVAMAADEGCSRQIAEHAVEQLEDLTAPTTAELRVSQFVRVAHYSPVIQNEHASQPCRISLLLTEDPNVTTTTASVTTTATTK